MNINETIEPEVKKLAEDNYVEAPASLRECSCPDEHNLHVALSEQNTGPEVYEPDRTKLTGALCATYGRCKK